MGLVEKVTASNRLDTGSSSGATERGSCSDLDSPSCCVTLWHLESLVASALHHALASWVDEAKLLAHCFHERMVESAGFLAPACRKEVSAQNTAAAAVHAEALAVAHRGACSPWVTACPVGPT